MGSPDVAPGCCLYWPLEVIGKWGHLGGHSSEYRGILSHPHTPRKTQDTKQRSSTLLWLKNTERKACDLSPVGKPLGAA